MTYECEYCGKEYDTGQELGGHKVRMHHSEAREKLEEGLSGEDNPMYGKTMSEERRQKISESLKGNLTGDDNPMRNKETAQKLSDIMKEKAEDGEHPMQNRDVARRSAENTDWSKQAEKISGEKNPMHGRTKELNPFWKGGKSFEPYPTEFTLSLKEEIRERDNRTCQFCGITEEELDRRLDVHHIDGDKKNCSITNLVALCHSCNMKMEGFGVRPQFESAEN